MIFQLLLAMLAGWIQRHQQRVIEEIEQLVVRMADEKPAWGYRRLQGAVANLGQHIDAITVRHMLRRRHLDPAPRRRQAGTRWGSSSSATGKSWLPGTSALWRWRRGKGLVTYYVLVELAMRRVHLVHGFHHTLRASGVEPGILPPQRADLNTYGERFVRSIKEEALHQMILRGEASLHYVLRAYLTHYHHERNHQGLSTQLIAPEPGMSSQSGQVRRRDRLDGWLSYYYRDAA
jgi:hypothetical protein